MPEQPDPQPPSVAALAALRERLAHVRLQRDGWRQRAENAEDRLRKATDAYTQLHAATTGTEATGDRWRQRAEEAERERDTAREALDAAAIVIASLRDQRDQARDANERVRRMAQVWIDIQPEHPTLTNEAHVLAYAGEQIIAALDAEQPKETR